MPLKVFQRAFQADNKLMFNLNVMGNVICHPFEKRWPSRDHTQIEKTIMNSTISKETFQRKW